MIRSGVDSWSSSRSSEPKAEATLTLEDELRDINDGLITRFVLQEVESKCGRGPLQFPRSIHRTQLTEALVVYSCTTRFGTGSNACKIVDSWIRPPRRCVWGLFPTCQQLRGSGEDPALFLGKILGRMYSSAQRYWRLKYSRAGVTAFKLWHLSFQLDIERYGPGAGAYIE